MHAKWVGWGSFALGLVVFGFLLWQTTRQTDSLVLDFDKKTAQEAKEHANGHEPLLKFVREATHEGGTQVMVAVALVGSLLLCMCGHPRLAAVWLLAATLGAAINQGTKQLVDRPRPSHELRDKSVHEENASFPSGHAMGSIIGYGTLAYAGVVLLRRRLAKFAVILLVVAIVGMIGWTRIYLRAHYASDVVAGWALGWCWLWLCIKVGGTGAK
jgi:membrane-associated phospholipid phosphatase